MSSDAVAACWRRRAPGRAAGCSIEGPPGIGKTRLLGARARAGGRRGARAAPRAGPSSSATSRSRSCASCSSRCVTRAEHFDGRGGAGARRCCAALGGAARTARPALHGLYWLAANLAARAPAARARRRPPLGRPRRRCAGSRTSRQRLDGLAGRASSPPRGPAEAGEGQPVLDVLAANPRRGARAARAERARPSRARSPARSGRRAGVRRRLRAGDRRQPVPARRAPARAAPTVAPTAANAALVERQTLAHGQPRRARPPAPPAARRRPRSPARS